MFMYKNEKKIIGIILIEVPIVFWTWMLWGTLDRETTAFIVTALLLFGSLFSLIIGLHLAANADN